GAYGKDAKKGAGYRVSKGSKPLLSYQGSPGYGKGANMPSYGKGKGK
ncbi:TPA: hypothetical protein HA265_04120, partial [Candidatus Woesearchaeota archaeon]|nr:hypothetical protein [Candidatus Woesearchaeota archaeon]